MHQKFLLIKYTYLYLLVFFALWVISGSIYTPPLLFENNIYDAKRLVHSFLLALLPIVFCSTIIALPRSKSILTGIGVFIFAGLLSSYYSGNLEKSLTGYWMITSIMLATLVFYNFEMKKSHIYVISILFSVAIFIFIYMIYISPYLELSQGLFRKEVVWFYHGYSNPRFLNQVQTWCLPLLIIADEFIRRAANISPAARLSLRTTLFITAVSYVSLIFVTGGRGTLIAYLISVPLLWVLFGKHFNATAKKILLWGVSGFLLYLLLYNLIPAMLIEQKLTGLTELEVVRSSDSGRIYLWQLAVETMLNHPILGVGPMMYSAVSHSSNHPHNSVLWLASEWGLIATISLIGLLIFLLYLYFKRIKNCCAQEHSKDSELSEEVVISYCLAISVVAAALHSFVSGLYIIPSSMVVGLPLVILCITAYKSLEKFTAENRLSPPIIILTLRTKLIIATYFLALLIPTYNYYNNSIWNPEENYNGYMQPGYWLNGDS